MTHCSGIGICLIISAQKVLISSMLSRRWFHSRSPSRGSLTSTFCHSLFEDVSGLLSVGSVWFSCGMEGDEVVSGQGLVTQESGSGLSSKPSPSGLLSELMDSVRMA